jgi:hypothetical protein
VGHHLMVREHALYEQFNFAAARFLTKNSGFDHLGVIENQQVSLCHQFWQCLENPVNDGLTLAVQKLGAAPFGRRVLGNQVGGQFEVKVAQVENTLRLRSLIC